MPTKLCAYGFSCALMMQQPGLTATDCPNKETCGTILKLTEEEEFELQQARIENQRKIIERIKLTSRDAAQFLLHQRGCTQSPESLGVIGYLNNLENKIAILKSAISELSENHYISPTETEIHQYTVKRPYGVYSYNKLSSKNPIFPAQIDNKKRKKVKSIHLSKNTDPRNIEGRLGIERRNRLQKTNTLLKSAIDSLDQAIELCYSDIEAVIDEYLLDNV